MIAWEKRLWISKSRCDWAWDLCCFVICWRSFAGEFLLNHHLRNIFWFTFYSGRKVAKSRFLLGNLQLPPRQMRKIRKLLTLPKEKSIFSRECLGFHKVWCDVFSSKYLDPWNVSGMDSTRSETVLHYSRWGGARWAGWDPRNSGCWPHENHL